MFTFARAFLLCGLLVTTLTAIDQNSLVDVRSEEEAYQGAFNEDDGAEIGQRLKRVTEGPPASEIRTITEQIWAADKNRLSDSDVVYNVEKWKSGAKFFTYVNEARLTATYARMIALFNAYEASTGTAKSREQDCRNRENDFLEAILDTRPIQLAHEWLAKKGLVPGLVSRETFKKTLHQYWFMAYTRSNGQPATSGFKHTYLGEIYDGQVNGLHNWVRMYIEEREGRLDYRKFTPCYAPFIKAIDFFWTPIQTTKFYYKSFSTAFIRTSPEVEIALYTICLLTRKNVNCNIQLNNIRLTISVSTLTQRGQETIKSAYPFC